MAKHDAKGRSKHSGRFIMVTHHMLDTPAGKSLTPHEIAALLRIMQIHNSQNNGRIAMSSRRMGKLAHMNKDTAARALKTLTAKGFLRICKPSGFGTNGRRAVEYEITCFAPTKGRPAKNTFQAWRPNVKENSSSGIRAATDPNQGHELQVSGA